MVENIQNKRNKQNNYIFLSEVTLFFKVILPRRKHLKNCNDNIKTYFTQYCFKNKIMIINTYFLHKRNKIKLNY